MAFKRVTIPNAHPTARSRRVAQLQGLLAEEETAAGCLVGNYFGKQMVKEKPLEQLLYLIWAFASHNPAHTHCNYGTAHTALS